MSTYTPGGTPTEGDTGEDQGCRRELNLALQGLQARVHQLEKDTASLKETALTQIGQTAAGFAALIEEGIVTGLPTYIANELILKIAATALGVSSSYLSGLGGAAGDLATQALDTMEEAMKEIALILSTPTLEDFWKQFQYLIMIPQLTIPTFASIIGSALAEADAAVESARTALLGALTDPDLQAAYIAALNLRATMQNAANAMDDLTQCKISSSVLGL